jgi:chromate transporter
VFVLAGGPLIESSHRQPAFQAPLMGITAAIVGVMLQLAVLFGSHVFWPSGLDHALNWWGVAVATLAGLALFMFKRSVMEVIVGCAVLGLVKIYF